jgi:Xaa-Pro aminopeptidase
MKKDLDRLMKEMKVAALYAEGSASADPTIYYLFNGVNINARFVKMAGKPAYVIHKSIEREEAAKTGHRLINMSLIDFRKILEKNRNAARANALVTKYLLDRLRVSGTVAFYGSAPLGNAYNYLRQIVSVNRRIKIFNSVRQDLVIQARETKDENEVNRIRIAGKGVVRAFDRLVKSVQKMKVKKNAIYKTGGEKLRIRDLKDMLRRELFNCGLINSNGLIVAQGRDAGVPHNSGRDNQPVELGRTIVFDIYPQEIGGGYFFDFTRTLCFGFAPQRYEDVFRVVKDAQDYAFDLLKIGERTIEIEKKVCRFFEKHGHPTMLSDRRTQIGYCHTLGHGVGLNVHESPSFGLLKTNRNVIKPGAVFTVEPGLYYPAAGYGVRLEDIIYVSPKGRFINLTDYPRRLVVEM